MKIVEVKSAKESSLFLKLPISIYKKNSHWIRPLDKDINDIFDPNKNDCFKTGKCKRWLLYNDSGTPIGRISAFINNLNNENLEEKRIGGLGFFECIDNQEAANTLFDTARNWLETFQITAIDGPINFGERDKWWGLLTKGYDLDPNYKCNYNPSYYQTLFENYGFQNYFEQYTFIRKINDPFHPRILYKTELIKKDPNYSFTHLDKKNLKQHTKDITTIYNKAWKKHEGVPQLSLEKAQSIMGELKPILDEKIIWIAYYNNEPVGFYFNIPEVNQVFKYVKGTMNFWGKCTFGWHQLLKTNKKMLGMIFGIVPEHQGKGLDGALIMACADMVQNHHKRYTTLEISGIGDFNRKMILVVKQVGGEVKKIHTTYRYQIDRSKPFERMKTIQ